ncbi:MAG TPA: Uma2 family endonuclease [Polyangia bacterium]|jgi:Uma2 family endonuclease
MRPEAQAPLLSGDEFYRRFVDQRVELWHGKVVSMPPVSSLHARTAVEIVYRLRQHVGAPGERGTVLVEAGFLLARDPDLVLAPDVALVRAQRELPPRGWIPGAPDLAVEVLSPEDVWRDVQRKVARYLDGGTALVWVADPDRATVVLFRADQPPATLGRGDSITGEPVLPDLTLAVTDLFPQSRG